MSEPQPDDVTVAIDDCCSTPARSPTEPITACPCCGTAERRRKPRR
ncbi:MAG TPA: hypothetical protein VHH52_00450 [Pseudonocardiaceae bacterium]|nr:hypothetical protein [Pseudonocardiaceae bacterium]